MINRFLLHGVKQVYRTRYLRTLAINLAMRMNSCKSITTNPPQKRSSFRKVQFQTCREHLNDKHSVGQLVVDTSRNKMHPPGYNSYLASRQPSGINHIHLLCLYLPQDMYFFFI